jgi:hypothetical protein
MAIFKTARSRRPKKKAAAQERLFGAAGATPPMLNQPILLPDDEILRRLRTIRYSSQALRNARRIQSINSLATETGLTRAGLYEVLRTGRLGRRSKPALSRA